MGLDLEVSLTSVLKSFLKERVTLLSMQIPRLAAQSGLCLLYKPCEGQ